MKRSFIILVVFSTLIILTGCQTPQTSKDNNNGASTPVKYNDTFNQEDWETDVNVSVNYADFTVGTWLFRKVYEDPDGTKKFTIGEFRILHDIIGNSVNNDDLQFIKIAEFENDGQNYSEYDMDDLDLKNSSSVKLYLLNRSSRGPLDTSKEKWSKSTVLLSNNGKTKFKSYSEEWALNSSTNSFAIYKTTYFFEKKSE